MDFLVKIEDLINKLLGRFGELFLNLCRKALPPVVKEFYSDIRSKIDSKIPKIGPKELPKMILAMVLKGITKVKEVLIAYDIKGKLKTTYSHAREKYKDTGLKKVRAALMTPILIVAEWLQGLTTTQSIMLLALSAASILAGVNMIFSGQRLLKQHMPERAPASIEEAGLEYDRPAYYKQNQRQLEFTSVRLPVYVAEVNELRSVDVDFNVTLSNRKSRNDLEKLEFQLRDHLILQIEPLTASFPLEDEGKDILKNKIWVEIDSFLAAREVEGKVVDLKITYILAN